jgi:hypothetical protein
MIIMEKKIFRSRISVVLVVFILAVFVLPQLYYGLDIGSNIIGSLALLLVTGIRYVIVGDRICLTIWIISTRGGVNINDSVSVRRSYNMISSPAASLKRLCLKFKKNPNYPYCLVSPVREREFLNALKSVNPDIDIQISDKRGMWRFWDWDF